MTEKAITNEQWHEDEKVWWNKYGHYMTFQWTLTPELNEALRSDMRDDYTDFLHKPSGSLLDIGCGGGWLSMHFAMKGMNVHGVDLSQEQINDANVLKEKHSLQNVSFECCDLVQWDCQKFEQGFDSVFVSAFLHHVPEDELQIIFDKIASVLKPGGRVYLYEPLCESAPGQGSPISRGVDFLYKAFVYVFSTLLPKHLGLYNEEYIQNVERGYQMCSPHERPVELDVLKKCCRDSFDIIEVKGRHLFSLGFAMHSMGLKETARAIYSKIAVVLYWADKCVFRLFRWSDFSQPKRFILCSVKLKRR